MNIAIVDDQTTERENAKRLLQDYARLRGIGIDCSLFVSGEELLRDYVPYRYAAVFLDVYMDGMTGIETAQKIRETDRDTVLFFLTTSDGHYADAFSVFAASYLKKPLDADELFRTLDHFLLRTDPSVRQESVFTFSYSRSNYALPFSDIVSMETKGNYLVIVDRNDETFRTRMTFTEARNTLDDRFLTLMKGVLVNMDFIANIEDCDCLLTSGAVLPVNRKKEKELRETWYNYKFAKIRGGG